MARFYKILGILSIMYLAIASYRGMTVGSLFGANMKEPMGTVGTTRGIYHK